MLIWKKAAKLFSLTWSSRALNMTNVAELEGFTVTIVDVVLVPATTVVVQLESCTTNVLCSNASKCLSVYGSSILLLATTIPLDAVFTVWNVFLSSFMRLSMSSRQYRPALT